MIRTIWHNTYAFPQGVQRKTLFAILRKAYWSVDVLRMRNVTSQTLVRFALGDNHGAPVRPDPGHGFVTTYPGGGRTSPGLDDELLDGGYPKRLHLASAAAGHRPSDTPARPPRLRLPGTTGLRFALHGRQHKLGYTDRISVFV